MILERFDGLVFIGDDTVRNIYLAFNILLRENVALGGLRQWDMDEAERSTCRCNNQFIKPECSRLAVTNNEEVRKNDAKGGHPSAYRCDRECGFIHCDASLHTCHSGSTRTQLVTSGAHNFSRDMF